jgi:hypothetical protein
VEAERWKQVEEIVQEAMSRPPSDVDAYLDQASFSKGRFPTCPATVLT